MKLMSNYGIMSKGVVFVGRANQPSYGFQHQGTYFFMYYRDDFLCWIWGNSCKIK